MQNAIVLDGIKLAGVGTAVGLAVMVPLTFPLGGFLAGVTPVNPVIIGAITVNVSAGDRAGRLNPRSPRQRHRSDHSTAPGVKLQGGNNVMTRLENTKPHLFARARVPWWSYVVFFLVLGLIMWLTDDLVRPAY